MSQPNATQDFLGDESYRCAASIELNDVQGLWGGHVIRVEGSRHVIVEIIPPAGSAQRREFEIGAAEWRELIRVLIENDFVTIQPIERSGIPDEGRPRITLVNAVGNQVVVSKWAGVEDQRFEAVQAALLRLKTFREE